MCYWNAVICVIIRVWLREYLLKYYWNTPLRYILLLWIILWCSIVFTTNILFFLVLFIYVFISAILRLLISLFIYLFICCCCFFFLFVLCSFFFIHFYYFYNSFCRSPRPHFGIRTVHRISFHVVRKYLNYFYSNIYITLSYSVSCSI